jgi:hypothetical protein
MEPLSSERPFDLQVNGGAIVTPVDVPADNSKYYAAPVWTGANDPNSAGTMASTCNGWTSNSLSDSGHQGFEGGASPQWFNYMDAPCNYASGSVLCFER